MLILLSFSMIYVVTRPSYNFSHWLPHGFFRNIGIPYNAVLWGERNADKLLHFGGAIVLTWLVYYSKLPTINHHKSFIIVMVLCIGAESVQLAIGRGFNSSDLLLGILGTFMAYLSITKNKHRHA